MVAEIWKLNNGPKDRKYIFFMVSNVIIEWETENLEVCLVIRTLNNFNHDYG